MLYISGDPCTSHGEGGISQILVANQSSSHLTGLVAGREKQQIPERAREQPCGTGDRGAISHATTLQWPAIVTHPQAIGMTPLLLISIFSAMECCSHADATLLASPAQHSMTGTARIAAIAATGKQLLQECCSCPGGCSKDC